MAVFYGPERLPSLARNIWKLIPQSNLTFLSSKLKSKRGLPANVHLGYAKSI